MLRQAAILRRLANRIAKFQEWNTDPRIAELLENARLDLANSVNLIYQLSKQKLAKPRKQKIVDRLNDGDTYKVIGLEFNISISRVRDIAHSQGLRRYKQRNSKCPQNLVHLPSS